MIEKFLIYIYECVENFKKYVEMFIQILKFFYKVYKKICFTFKHEKILEKFYIWIKEYVQFFFNLIDNIKFELYNFWENVNLINFLEKIVNQSIDWIKVNVYLICKGIQCIILHPTPILQISFYFFIGGFFICVYVFGFAFPYIKEVEEASKASEEEYAREKKNAEIQKQMAMKIQFDQEEVQHFKRIAFWKQKEIEKKEYFDSLFNKKKF